MPYEVVRSSECPSDKPWAVVKEGGDDPIGCHADRGSASKQMAALYANESRGKATEVKASILDDDHLRLLALPFGGPIPSPKSPLGVDVEGEFFSPRTDFKADWLDMRLVDWHHGDDPTLGREVIGKATNLTFDDEGGWVDLWLERGARRLDLVRRLAERGAQLFGSSETVSRMVQKDPDTGEILVWPYLRQTLSTSPVNTLSVIRGKAMLDLPASIWAKFEADLASDLPTAATIGQQGTSTRGIRALDAALEAWKRP